jgi:hypothetical protein
MQEKAMGLTPEAVPTGAANAYSGMATPGMNGSRAQIQAKQLAAKNAVSGGTGGTFGQMVGANPQLEQYRNSGRQRGQNMSWMDRPGAIQMPPPTSAQEQGVQSGLQPLQTPYEQQIMQQKMAANPDLEMGAAQSRIGPSNPEAMLGEQVQMDENGLERRRGPR